MFIVLTTRGRTVTECYAGCTAERAAAERLAAMVCGEAHAATHEGIAKIEAQIALEQEFMETLRTGLGRRTRGTT